MVEAVADEMTLAVSSGDMYGDEIESAEVTFSNDYGIVSVNDIADSLTGYELIVDGKVATSWPTVTLEEQNVEVVYRTSTGVLKATAKISAGEDYIANPATDNGVIEASLPPAIITSSYPSLILWKASPIAFVPAAHAVTTEDT